MPLAAISNAKIYDWKTWLLGIMRSFMSGGGAALLTLGGAAYVQLPPAKMWAMVGVNFLGMGLYRMGEFLQLHGAPEIAAEWPKQDDAQKP